MRLDELNLTMSDVELGGIDAESDPKLDDDFVTTRFVESALDGQRNLFLGRKGSGKSAVFRKLPRLMADEGRDVHVSQLTPDQYAWSALKSYQEAGLLPEQAHTNAWKLTLALEAAAKLAGLDRNWSAHAQERVKRLQDFVRNNFGELDSSLSKTASAVLKQLEGFNLQAFGFGVGFSQERTEAEQRITPAITDTVLSDAALLVEECGLVLELDRLDDSWDGSDEAKSLLIGLLKAAKSINDRFGGLKQDHGLRILVFLRSDIYDVLKFDDKDKHRATEEHLLWDEEKLKELLTKRLPPDVGADDIFERGTMRGSPPFSHILNRTFLRPRELLQFVELGKGVAGLGATEMGADRLTSRGLWEGGQGRRCRGLQA